MVTESRARSLLFFLASIADEITAAFVTGKAKDIFSLYP